MWNTKREALLRRGFPLEVLNRMEPNYFTTFIFCV